MKVITRRRGSRRGGGAETEAELQPSLRTIKSCYGDEIFFER